MFRVTARVDFKSYESPCYVIENADHPFSTLQHDNFLNVDGQPSTFVVDKNGAFNAVFNNKENAEKVLNKWLETQKIMFNDLKVGEKFKFENEIYRKAQYVGISGSIDPSYGVSDKDPTSFRFFTYNTMVTRCQ